VQRDRYGEVIPTIARIEQPIIVAFKLTGEKDNEPAQDVSLDHLQDLRYTREAKKGADTENGNHRTGRDF